MSIDYKNTIKLPQTDFPMKGNLPQREPEILKTWQNINLYNRLLEKNKSGQIFSIPDGPPYANGSIHIGHALNKVLKDMIVKYKTLRGYRTAFIPGWDCHGLPIEHKVMKDLAEKKQIKSDQEILALCRAEAQKWVDHQKEQFIRLGVLADWQNPYLTMSKDYEAEEVREFARSYEKGLIYRGEKPVYWDWTIQTALADAEVEYHDHKSPAIYVKFPLTDSVALKKIQATDKPVSLVIWTTTPWTLPANLGVCLHADFDYGVFEYQNELLIIAKSLKEFFEKDTGHQLKLRTVFKGAELENAKAEHPWMKRTSLVILGEHVTQDAGTGLVHTAPGHGPDDYKVGLKYQLGLLNPVDEKGLFNELAGEEYKGLNIFKANPLIVERLKTSGHLLGHKDIVHSYPHCWRTKAPLIYRTTPQWFLGLDLENSQIRQKSLEWLNKIEFYPDWGRARFTAMLENRPDWCLSRQRIWGVPIPILICQKTGEPLAHFEVMMKIADTIEKGGIEAYWNTPADQFVQGLQVQQGDFGSEGFKHGRDILDVWFDSGVCHAAVQRKRGLGFPADIYLEGSDQHRGWFNTSLLSSIATQNQPPFKALLTHGFVTDSQGRKMSKSLGNVVDPNEVTSKSGAEIVRLWAASEDYGGDVGCSKEALDRVTETYRKYRNTIRYLLGATSDFKLSQNAVAIEQLTPIDRYALHELSELIERVTEHYEKYDFLKAAQQLTLFINVFLSSTYLDILKDRLYTWKPDGLPRRSSQTVISLITESLLKMLSPMTSFLSEEAWSHYSGKNTDSIFLTEWPQAQSNWKNSQIKADFDEILKVRTEVQKKLEELRNQKIIGASLEASVVITAEGKVLELLNKYRKELPEILIVSQVEVQKGPFALMATKAPGSKCIRCWTYSEKIGAHPDHPEICPKCVEALL